LDLGARLFGLNPGAWIWIAAILVALHMLIGLLAGWLAWSAGHLLQERVSGSILTIPGS
jgi:hypothetical protein